MAKVKLIFLIIMVILAGVTFAAPFIFPEKKGTNHNRRIRNVVRLKLGCFLGILVFLLLCVIL